MSFFSVYENGERVGSPRELVSWIDSNFSIDDYDHNYLFFISKDDYSLRFSVKLPFVDLTGYSDLWVTRCLSRIGDANVDENSFAILVVFDDVLLSDDYLSVADELDDALGGIDFADKLIVSKTHWRSLLCYDDDCCPVKGTAISNVESDGDVSYPVNSVLLDVMFDKADVVSGTDIPIGSWNKDERLEIVKQWEKLSLFMGSWGDAVSKLHDIKIRDAFLRSYVDWNQDTRSSVKYELIECAKHVDGSLSIAVFAALAAVSLLDDDFETACTAIVAAKQTGGLNNLLRLMDRAIDSTGERACALFKKSVVDTTLEECVS